MGVATPCTSNDVGTPAPNQLRQVSRCHGGAVAAPRCPHAAYVETQHDVAPFGAPWLQPRDGVARLPTSQHGTAADRHLYGVRSCRYPVLDRQRAVLSVPPPALQLRLPASSGAALMTRPRRHARGLVYTATHDDGGHTISRVTWSVTWHGCGHPCGVTSPWLLNNNIWVCCHCGSMNGKPECEVVCRLCRAREADHAR